MVFCYRMLLHALGLAIMLVILSMSGKGMTSAQEQSNSKELLDRDIRAPFNGMRGKRDPSDDAFYNRVGLVINMLRRLVICHFQMLLKRAAFTGMRGRRAPFNGMRGKRGEEVGDTCI